MIGVSQRFPGSKSLFSATPDANAKLVRKFSELLAKAHEHGIDESMHLLEHCSKRQSFSSLATPDTEVLFGAIQAALLSQKPNVRYLALHTVIAVCRYVRPSLICPFWVTIAQKVVSMVKVIQTAADESSYSLALMALASLISAASPIAQLGGEHKASVSTISQSAVVHASRTLDETQSPAGIIGAVLAVFLSVLHTAPREIRASTNRLEDVLWNRYFHHPNAEVREISAQLYAYTLACFPDRLQSKIFDERLKGACQELDDIVEIMEVFTSSEEKQPVKSSVATRRLSCKQLSSRYSAICCLVKASVQQASSTRLPLPIPSLVHTLCNGVGVRTIDPFASADGDLGLNPDDALLLQASIFEDSIEALRVVSSAGHRAAVLPYAAIIGRTFTRRLSHMIIQSRSKQGLVAGLFERVKTYNAIETLVGVLGSSFIERTTPLFVELFEADAKLYSTAQMSAHAFLPEKTGLLLDSNRSRKRRRHNRESMQGNGTRSVSAGVESTRILGPALGQTTVADIKNVFVEGLKVATAVFENRGLLSKQACLCLDKLEAFLSDAVEGDARIPCLFECLRAAVAGGGSNRMKAEACTLFWSSSLLVKSAPDLLSNSGDMCREAIATRASCEALIHPRAAPVVRPVTTHRSGPPSQQVQKQSLGDVPPRELDLVDKSGDERKTDTERNGPVSDIEVGNVRREDAAREPQVLDQTPDMNLLSSQGEMAPSQSKRETACAQKVTDTVVVADKVRSESRMEGSTVDKATTRNEMSHRKASELQGSEGPPKTETLQTSSRVNLSSSAVKTGGSDGNSRAHLTISGEKVDRSDSATVDASRMASSAISPEEEAESDLILSLRFEESDED